MRLYTSLYMPENCLDKWAVPRSGKWEECECEWAVGESRGVGEGGAEEGVEQSRGRCGKP